MDMKELVNNPHNTKLIELALSEDAVFNDITTQATFFKKPSLLNTLATATIIAKQQSIACGTELVPLILKIAKMDDKIKVSSFYKDGEILNPNSPWIRLDGSAESLLRIERTLLNFLIRMTGIATYSANIVKLIEGTSTKILHTRKTTPGHRYLDIYSCLTGGAHPHRQSLEDAILVKENHFRTGVSYQEISDGIQALRSKARFVEIEVTNFIELKYAMEAKPNRIMLDNFSVKDVKKAVDVFGAAMEFEASGGINESNVRAYAETGVDYISMGSLTHSFTGIDLSMKFSFK